MEIWKDIIGFEGYYKVSNKGNIYSIRNKRELKLNLKPNGYLTIELNVDGVATYHRVHRLVALAFIPNPMNKEYINHINGIKNDNRVENLEWCTPSENNIHAIENRLSSIDHLKKKYILMNDKDVIIFECIGLENMVEYTGYSSSAILLNIRNNKSFSKGKLKSCKIKRV